MKYSIVINVRNGEDFLQQCIKSAITATENIRDSEILIVDNNSTDATYPIATSFKSESIKVHQTKQDKSLGYVRNLAVSLASGTHIVFLDSDDLLHPDILKEHESRFHGLSNAITYARIQVIDADWQFKYHERFMDSPRPPTFEGNIRKHLLRENFIYFTGSIVPRHLLTAYPFDEELNHAEDWDVFLSLSEHYLFYISGKAYYRLHSKNLSNDSTEIWLREIARILKKFNSTESKIIYMSEVFFRARIEMRKHKGFSWLKKVEKRYLVAILFRAIHDKSWRLLRMRWQTKVWLREDANKLVGIRGRRSSPRVENA